MTVFFNLLTSATELLAVLAIILVVFTLVTLTLLWVDFDLLRKACHDLIISKKSQYYLISYRLKDYNFYVKSYSENRIGMTNDFNAALRFALDDNFIQAQRLAVSNYPTLVWSITKVTHTQAMAWPVRAINAYFLFCLNTVAMFRKTYPS